ncbi:F16B2 protein, partial [Rhinoptilus africanus]|nr:F16B2 protein [Rhinoptilus africanus]
SADESIPAGQTDIPWRLRQMLDILVYEEKQRPVGEAGPCLEYLLQHKVLETLGTLGKAEYPPGMRQQVLLFFSRVLGQMQHPLLHYLNVHRPVQKLLQLSGDRLGSGTEKEEVQFAAVLCTKIKEDPSLLAYILEVSTPRGRWRVRCFAAPLPLQGKSILNGRRAQELPASPMEEGREHPPGTAAAAEVSPPRRDGNLVTSLVGLCKSQKSRVALKARENLLSLVGLAQEAAAACLARSSSLCRLLTEHLCDLYSAVPPGTDPSDVLALQRGSWRSQGEAAGDGVFPGKESLAAFFAWLDYLDELVMGAHPVVADAITEALEEKFFQGILQPQLLEMSEVAVLGVTAMLTGTVRQLRAPPLLHRLVLFLLGPDRHPETLGDAPHPLRTHLIDRCNHLSDEVSPILGCCGGGTWDVGHAGGQWRGAHPPPPGGRGGGLHPPPHPSPHPSPLSSSFLCLVPEEAKTSSCAEEGGYDTYVHDALGTVSAWSWGGGFPIPGGASPRSGSHPPSPPHPGRHFLKVLFDRMSRILDQPYSLNLQVTSVLSRLAAFPHPHLHEYLLDPYLTLAPG